MSRRIVFARKNSNYYLYVMSKLIYLIGAGASYGERNEELNGMSRYVSGMPIMNEMADCLSRYCEYLQPSISIGERSFKTPYPLVYEEMSWLRDVAMKNSTVDTYAMKLSKTGQLQELKRLKKALAIFFSLIQFCSLYNTFIILSI